MKPITKAIFLTIYCLLYFSAIVLTPLIWKVDVALVVFTISVFGAFLGMVFFWVIDWLDE